MNKLTSINSVTLAENINEWHKTLTSIKNYSSLPLHPVPRKLLNYVLDEIEEIKSFMPLIGRLRAKGLERRHFIEISEELGTNIDPI
jgi:hypothetical protein